MTKRTLSTLVAVVVTLSLAASAGARGTHPAGTAQKAQHTRAAGTGSTTLAKPAAVGATTIKVTSINGFTAGDIVGIGSDTAIEMDTVAGVGTAGAGGTGLTLADPLTAPHASGSAVVKPKPLSIRQHTQIMQAVMANVVPLTARLHVRQYVATGTSPSAQTILAAALTMPQFDTKMKERMKLSLAIVQRLDAAQTTVPAAEQQKLHAIDDQIAQETSYEGLTSTLKSLGKQYADDAGLASGISVGAGILSDGAKSIYCPWPGGSPGPYWPYPPCSPFPPYGGPGGGGSAYSVAGEVGKSDVGGAVAGGLIGLGVGGIGAGPGALGGAVGASVAKGVELFIDWCFS